MMHDADAVVVSRPTGCSCKRSVRPDCPNRKVFSDQMISVGNLDACMTCFTCFTYITSHQWTSGIGNLSCQ